MSEDEHIQPEKLFALLWANQDKKPAPLVGDEEEGDLELKRMFDDMGERFEKSLAPEHRLGPETAARLWEHSLDCKTCRLLLLEDGPGSRPPKTQAEIQTDFDTKEKAHKKKVVKFWIDLVVGGGAFGGAFWCMQTIRAKEAMGPVGPVLQSVGPKQIDPLWYGFVVLLLIASWFLAESYTIARDLWIDFDAWKRAVPVVGKKWADRDKKKNQQGK